MTEHTSESQFSASPTLDSARQLSGRILALARSIWLVCVSLVLIFVVTTYQDASRILANPGSNHAVIPGLYRSGVSTTLIVRVTSIGDALFFVTCFLLAIVIIALRSKDWLAMYVSLGNVLTGVFFTDKFLTLIWDAEISSLGGISSMILAVITQIMIYTFWFFFPNGRFVPKWSPLVVLAWSIWIAYFFLSTPESPFAPAYSLTNIAFNGLAIGAQVYRYRRFSTYTERQQTKWILPSIVAALVLLSTSLFVYQLALPGGRPFWLLMVNWLGVGTLFRLAALFIPISLALAMVNYRLRDADFVLNRSLTYGLVTALLLVSFFASSVGLQFSIRALTGSDQSSVIAIAASTLLMAGLFQPTRSRLRRIVDKGVFGIEIDYKRALAEKATREAIARKVTSASEQRFAAYELLDIVGRGGMGAVYRSKHPALNRDVAVKVLPTWLADDNRFRERFLQEAQIIARISHPNIVQVFDLVESAGQCAIILEFIDGPDLGSYLRDKGPLDMESCNALLSQVASALDYAHSMDIVHRDVKPSNVLLEHQAPRLSERSAFRAVLTDFGLAKIIGSGTKLTASGLIGTFDYMAPEQIQASSQITSAADIYSLGAMAFEMLTGQPPFPDKNPAAILLAHLRVPPPNASQVDPTIPLAISRAIIKALAKQPEKRFRSAGEFHAAMSR